MLPTAHRSASLARRFAFGLVVLSGAGALVWLWWNAVWRSETSFLPRRSAAEWIVDPSLPERLLGYDVTTTRKARELALAGGQKGLEKKKRKLIEFFSARQPCREPTQP
jgi:hypothetical protein